ncbi:hypothetical protein AKJ16_DCAP24187 [Drosera capensis]
MRHNLTRSMQGNNASIRSKDGGALVSNCKSVSLHAQLRDMAVTVRRIHTAGADMFSELLTINESLGFWLELYPQLWSPVPLMQKDLNEASLEIGIELWIFLQK